MKVRYLVFSYFITTTSHILLLFYCRTRSVLAGIPTQSVGTRKTYYLLKTY
ncbi:hypothetical protein THIOM_002300 [Candidatus Thiomargarita nelsonii]|uniref:Uncharacterized protein n=1 Tax=Candidatus Thiomargarita nelsonii TaxID=1003181 RepID=A0A176S1Y4_9GAMM|nr:hypothetical protein THIOM_002300 [Candidatus Thiomargarita nelsonii]